jgi:hypothetical protein
MPAFEAAYTMELPTPVVPEVEAILMMDAPGCWRKKGTEARMH